MGKWPDMGRCGPSLMGFWIKTSGLWSHMTDGLTNQVHLHCIDLSANSGLTSQVVSHDSGLSSQVLLYLYINIE